MAYRLNKTGLEVEQLLDKIDNLKEATTIRSGMMTANDKRKLDQLEQIEPIGICEIEELLNF